MYGFPVFLAWGVQGVQNTTKNRRQNPKRWKHNWSGEENKKREILSEGQC